MTHYELLGVSQDATLEEIESAYRRASKAYHPDAGGPVSNPALFRAAVEARRVLTDSYERKKYDAELLGVQYSQRPSNVKGPAPPQQSRRGEATQVPSNSSSPTRRRKMQRSYWLLVIAGTDYVVGRWFIQFGIRVHAAPITILAHQFMGLAIFPAIAFFIIPKKGILRFWARCHAQLTKHRKIGAIRFKPSRTVSNSKS